MPDGVFERGIVDQPDENPGQDVYWAYETGSGLLIISREELKGEPLKGNTVSKSQIAVDGGRPRAKYRSKGSTTQQGESNSYSATIPKQFFDDYKGRPERTGELNDQVPEHARVEDGEERHFLSREAFLEPATKNPCFLLTTNELTRIIGSYRDLKGSVGPIPNFLKD